MVFFVMALFSWTDKVWESFCMGYRFLLSHAVQLGKNTQWLKEVKVQGQWATIMGYTEATLHNGECGMRWASFQITDTEQVIDSSVDYRDRGVFLLFPNRVNGGGQYIIGGANEDNIKGHISRVVGSSGELLGGTFNGWISGGVIAGVNPSINLVSFFTQDGGDGSADPRERFNIESGSTNGDISDNVYVWASNVDGSLKIVRDAATGLGSWSDLDIDVGIVLIIFTNKEGSV